MVIFRKSDCNREKVVVLGQKGFFRVKWFYSGKSGCIRACLVLFWQSCCVRAKVVVFG